MARREQQARAHRSAGRVTSGRGPGTSCVGGVWRAGLRPELLQSTCNKQSYPTPSGCPTCGMILTKCAVCATELDLSLVKKCGRCATRYCGPECQKQHWEGGGHDKLCKPIKKAGGPSRTTQIRNMLRPWRSRRECARTRRASVLHLPQAVHWKTKEGSCAVFVPRNGGFAHVAWRSRRRFWSRGRGEQLGRQAVQRGGRGGTHSPCKQKHHGVVNCALGWAVENDGSRRRTGPGEVQ